MKLATSIAADALPPPDQIDLDDVQAFMFTPPASGGAWQYRDRRPGGATAVELEAVWLQVPRDQVGAFRLHHRLYSYGPPFELVVPCDPAPWKVTYAGPLQVSALSQTISRVRVLLARALPASI